MMRSGAAHSTQQAARGKDEVVNHRLVTILAGGKGYAYCLVSYTGHSSR